MFNLNALVQKAQSIIDPSTINSKATDGAPSKAALFRLQFRLPDSQNPLYETTAELSLSATRPRRSTQPHGEKPRVNDRGNTYVGKLHLSESFLCFSTQPTSFLPGSSIQASSGLQGRRMVLDPQEMALHFHFVLYAVWKGYRHRTLFMLWH